MSRYTILGKDYNRKESGTEIGNSLEFDFCPTSAQLSRAVKADEISVVEPTHPLHLARQSKKEARTFVPASFLAQIRYF